MHYDELQKLYELPLFDLLQKARAVHEEHWPEREVQLCTLLSIKTGKCPENCSYCSQSVHSETALEATPLMDVEEVRRGARAARDAGAHRYCMGAGWRQPRDDAEFEQVLDMVREVRALGMEACVTLGMLTADQAQRLAEAGLTSYNHNIDTSPEFYDQVVTTRTFDDRLATLRVVSDAGIKTCAGGILGLGEKVMDRLRMIEVLSSLSPQPESVPINRLVPIPGTPLEHQPQVDDLEVARIVALARIAMPRSRVRLAAGREGMSEETQALCFFAGANSIFYGSHLLTTDNPEEDQDLAMLKRLGLEPSRELTPASR